MPRTDLPAMLLGQWQSAPRLMAIAEFLREIRDGILDGHEQIGMQLSLDDAVGVWLDWLGLRIGLRRPAVSDPVRDERWGFDDAGRGFDLVPFQGAAENDAVYPLPDVLFQQLIRARSVVVFGQGTLSEFRLAISHIDPTATVVDHRTMAVTVTTRETALVELADRVRALPRTAGVAMTVVAA